MKLLIYFYRSIGMALGLICCSLNAQTILHSNDVVLFQFTSLPWTDVDSSVHAAPYVQLIYRGTNGDSFRTEFFEDSTLQTPFYSNTNNSPFLGSYTQKTDYDFSFPTRKWTDRQGVIRFTGLGGTIVLTNTTVQVWDGTNVYRQILPITSPPGGLASQITIHPAIEIAWPTQSTNSYQIQWSSSLNTNDWFNLGTPIQGNGTTNYYLISTRGSEKQFYRVMTIIP